MILLAIAVIIFMVDQSNSSMVEIIITLEVITICSLYYLIFGLVLADQSLFYHIGQGGIVK